MREKNSNEAVVMGLGFGHGETLEVIHQSGEEFGRYSGYRLKRTSAE